MHLGPTPGQHRHPSWSVQLSKDGRHVCLAGWLSVSVFWGFAVFMMMTIISNSHYFQHVPKYLMRATQPAESETSAAPNDGQEGDTTELNVPLACLSNCNA
jgi:hypothetical protein